VLLTCLMNIFCVICNGLYTLVAELAGNYFTGFLFQFRSYLASSGSPAL